VIITSCPLRISLVGGSTDHPDFIKKYKAGSVISFPSTLRTYVTIHQDIFGTNSIDKRYNISYSSRETVDSISDIKNELVRNCFRYLSVDKINCTLVSDIYSAGSGLAASSSYLQALIKSIYLLREQNITEFEVCKIAENIERSFNRLVGQQDFYGSMGGLKRINFFEGKDPEIKYLSTNIFNNFDITLLYTGILRSSTVVLDSIDIDKSVTLLNDVEDLEQAINKCDIDLFSKVMNRSWQNKKNTSSLICENDTLRNIDEKLYNDSRILCHKLCGAGNGGYFLIFSKKGSNLEYDYPMMKQIGISETGLKYINLKNEFTKI
jgi:D-glycero-alpha-D-manno-heptose-7-phosphate kinase